MTEQDAGSGDLERARELVGAALACLEASRQRIDDLNVYPVPDGDTGTNLTLTVRAVAGALAASSAHGRPAIAAEVARSALLGARGNSGVILSQILRGAAEVLGASPVVDASVVARAARAAADAGYAAVREPVEGTILTVAREVAEEAEDRSSSEDVADVLRALVRRGEQALARTQELLDVLRDAGVVDAGGAGLVELLRGLVAGATGEALPEAPPETLAVGLDAVHQELSRYRYCTVFVVQGDELDAAALERELDPLGDSLLVVGDRSALKIHVHTDDPGRVLGAGTAIGVLDGVEIANMHRQTVDRETRLLEHESAALPTLETGLVAVAPGAGNRRLFEGFGATRVIAGGQTMNPSTADILAAVEATPAADVLVLPNNPNVLLSAEQAAVLASKRVRVVPSRSVPAGLAAIVRYLPTSTIAENEAAMLEALDGVAAGELTVASRDAELDGVAVREGAYLGLADGVAVASGPDLVEVAGAVADRLLRDGTRELLTLLTGKDEPDLGDLLSRLHERHPGVEIDVQSGGQPHYPLLLGAE